MIVLFVKLCNNVRLLVEATMVGFNLEKRYIAKNRTYVIRKSDKMDGAVG